MFNISCYPHKRDSPCGDCLSNVASRKMAQVGKLIGYSTGTGEEDAVPIGGHGMMPTVGSLKGRKYSDPRGKCCSLVQPTCHTCFGTDNKRELCVGKDFARLLMIKLGWI